MNNLTRYHIGDTVIVGKDTNGYPHIEVTILAKAIRMIKVRSSNAKWYWGESKIRWLAASEGWHVVSKIRGGKYDNRM